MTPRAATRVAWVLVLAGCVDRAPGEPWNLPPAPLPAHTSTPERIELGRRLFFDPRLSGDDSIACATCHAPELAFTDALARSDVGASGALLPRNAPALANLAWASSLFWDGGAKNLESFVFAPIASPDEMAQDPRALVAELGADELYAEEFARAFPGESVSVSTVMRAVAAYLRSLVSATSRYDRWRRGEGASLSADELTGLSVYEARCSRCHATDLFTDHQFHNDGLENSFEYPENDPRLGRARITFDPNDLGAFRTPTLRNLGYTAPYMHDGRFTTIDEVLDHYATGVEDSTSLDPSLRGDDGRLGIELVTEDRRTLLAFLRTLDAPDFVRASSR